MDKTFFKKVLVHYDEVALKKSNRLKFENILIKNIELKLKDFGLKKIQRDWGRLVLEFSQKDFFDKIKNILGRIPGIHSFCLAYEFEKDFNLMKQVLDLFSKEFENVSTFAIDVKRADKNFYPDSNFCEKELGALVLEKFPHLKVNLQKPDLTIFYEITYKKIYCYINKFFGLGGLPVGSSGKMLSLLSGGIDSPVASFLMMKRGVQVDFIHFKNFTQASNNVQDKIFRLTKVLSSYQNKSNLFIVNFDNIQKSIIAHIQARYRMIIYRRFMLRIAERIAKENQSLGLITGDSIGQVASQTLENLNTVHNVSDLFIARPLIGMNKSEIIKLAREIGTYEISILPYDDCCSMFISEHPETKSNLEYIKKLEQDLNIDELINNAIKRTEKFRI